jgi:TonB-linked SusC/RagA family outer membrane protein
VIVKGTSSGAVTDVDGKYSVSAPSNGVLEFHYIGFETKVVPINGKTVINVTLDADAIDVEEVIVVAYGVQSKRTVTASIASVNGDSFKEITSPNAESALQGRAAGVSIITPNGGVGQPPVVRVRGVSSITSGTEPLYVVDGVPIQSGNIANIGTVNALADINPADILTMDVLKDAAAAAMYGSRAANGVVLITTRKGSQDRTKVTYNGWVGVTTPTKMIEMMNAEQFVEFKNLSVYNAYGTDEMSLTSGYTSPFGNRAYNPWQRSDGSYVDTNWSDYIYQTGLQHSHSVAISGGTQRVQYYFSGNYTDQKGMVVNDHYDRLGAAANVSAKVTDWLKLSISLNGTTSNTAYSDKGRNGGIFAIENFSRMAMILPPNIPVYNDDGSLYLGADGVLNYGPNTVKVTGYPNPQALIDFGSGRNSENARLISSYSAEINPIAGLTIKTLLGIDYTSLAEQTFNNPFVGDGYNANAASAGSVTVNHTKNVARTWTNTANYIFHIGEHHNFEVLGGVETYSRDKNRWGANRTGILDTKFQVFQADYNNNYASNGTDPIDESSLMSFLGRINYDYDARYILSLNFRRDGFSALSPKNKWGNFGGGSVAWRISEEKFFAPLKHIFSDLKIKGSWGVVGNTNIKSYAAKTYYQSQFYGTNSVYYLSNIGDTENLKWESSTKLDVGFSAQLFNKVNVEFDYYNNSASDLIMNVPVAPSKGIPNNYLTTNAGKMSNQGIEFSISATPVRTREFSWNTSFNIATQKNEVIKLADGIDEMVIGSNNMLNITLPGYSIGQLYIRPSNGVDPETGSRILIGKNGEEVLHTWDGRSSKFATRDGKPYSQSDILPEIAGGTMPTYYGGWTNEIKYKNLDFSLLLQYSGGNYIVNGGTATVSDMRFWNNSVDVYENSWRKPGDVAKYAKPVYGDNVSNGSSFPFTDYVEKGDYVRAKNVTLGYTVDTKKWGKSGISSLRFYASAQNLFTITSYSGIDPESLISTNSDAALAGGLDKNTLPQSKVYTFGVNISF